MSHVLAQITPTLSHRGLIATSHKNRSLLVKFEGFHEQKKVPAREPPNFYLLLGTVATGTVQFSLWGPLYEIGHFDRPI